jgi:hypothetical protein
MNEFEYESEWELEGEAESEQFFGSLARLARRAAQSPALRRVGLSAARAALGGFRNVGSAIGGSLAGGAGSQLGGQLAGQLAGHLGRMLPAREFEMEYEGEFEGEWEGEFEGEGEWELESELNPIRRVYPDALMEHLGHAATAARNEAEAEAFIGALVPLATTLLPRLAPAAARIGARAIPQAVGMMRNIAPRLISGVARTTRVLRQNPATRQLVRTLPAVVRGTVADIARQYAGGQSVTPQRAGQTLARHTSRVLSNPQIAVQAFRRSRALDRQYHRAAGGQPGGGGGRSQPRRCQCAG